MQNRSQSIKIALAAVGASLATVLIVLTNLLPAGIFFSTFAAVCYYIVFEKAGIAHGILCIAAASALSFIMPFGAGQFINLFLFAPYSVLAFLIRKLRYNKAATAILRAAVIVVFANLIFMAIFFSAVALLPELAVLGFVESLNGGYAVAAVLVTLAGIVIDIGFSYACRVMCAKIKIGGRK